MNQGSCHIIKKGILASIQYAPNTDFVSLGVPSGGPMDSESAAIANDLAGNLPSHPVIEIAIGGLTIQFDNAAIICLYGAHENLSIDENVERAGKAITVSAGSTVSIQPTNRGLYSYLAIRGLETKRLAIHTTPLLQGQSISYSYSDATIRQEICQYEKPSSNIAIQKGLEWYLLTDKQKSLIKNQSYSLSSKSNRQAYLLESKVTFEHDLSIPSSPTIPGTVQLLPSGTIAVLMRDGQTIGGYPRIGWINEREINMLAQQTFGTAIKLSL